MGCHRLIETNQNRKKHITLAPQTELYLNLIRKNSSINTTRTTVIHIFLKSKIDPDSISYLPSKINPKWITELNAKSSFKKCDMGIVRIFSCPQRKKNILWQCPTHKENKHLLTWFTLKLINSIK